jgi:hypothetical protein
MYRFDFTPIFDLPLCAVVLCAFILHFNRWAIKFEGSTIDLPSRLPKARRRVVLLFVLLVLLCWALNIAFWSVFAFLLVLGIVVATFAGGDGGGAFALVGAAMLIREWAFDFPQFVLHPPSVGHSASVRLEESVKLIGMTGVTSSPLRPIGEAHIDGQRHSVVSHDGTWIDEGTPIVVKSWRNGLPEVAPI